MPKDDPNELFYLVDEEDKVLGSIPRAAAHADASKIHRAVYVLVLNSKKQMLFQKRSQHKDLYRGYWALSCAGHVPYGQDYRQAAVDELMEELRIKPDLFYVTNLLVKAEGESEHCQIYLTKMDAMPTDFDRDEIDELKWVDIDGIQEFVSANPLPPADVEVLRLLLYIK
jgi:isopentenyl-diphosphate Delta-isomerase